MTGVERRGAGELAVAVERPDDAASIALTRALVEAGVGVAELTRERETLEERFLQITGGATADEVRP